MGDSTEKTSEGESLKMDHPNHRGKRLTGRVKVITMMDHPNYRGKRLTSKVKITTMTTMEDSTGKSNEGGNESTGRKTKEKEAVKKSTGNVWSEAAKAAKLERKVMQETCPPVHKGKKGHGGARVTVVEKRRYITRCHLRKSLLPCEP
ncbi:uncharacterized protein LOC144647869 [Oculina patagonica]